MNNNNLDDIFEEDWPEDHRSGVIAVVGRPNVGKSTLINRILGQKIAIVTHKPQTTRKRQLGIYTTEKGQMILVDTPGLHKPHHKLGEYMVGVAEYAVQDADLILWVIDASEPPTQSDKFIADTVQRLRGDTPVVLALNKVDLTDDDTFKKHSDLIEQAHVMPVSALKGTNVEELLSYLLSQLPLGPRYYPADQVSEANLRFIAAEVVREKIILNTEQEIPHSVAVEIDSFKERENNVTYISAMIYVERDSQKGIIIGKGGSMIKRLGTEARKELHNILETKVYLDLRVKVLKNWRSNEALMRRMGYKLPKKDK
jgi:GTPase